MSAPRVHGVSVSGVHTCVEVPEFGLVFDMGLCWESSVKISNVLISHTHTDHCAGVVRHAALREMAGLPAATYYVPAGSAKLLVEHFEAAGRLSGDEIPFNVKGVEAGDTFQVNRRSVTVFGTSHRIPSVGYRVMETSRKLRPDLVGQSEVEIRAAVLRGENVNVPAVRHVLAYTGDTRIDGHVANVDVLHDVEVLITEMTFLEADVPVEKARQHGHTHLLEVKAAEHLFPQEFVVFTHFSQRYDHANVRSLIEPHLSADLRDRMVIL